MSDILLVEDDLSLRTQVESYLEGKGFDVQCAMNGREALIHLKDRAFDVIILDMRLPDIAGIDVLKTVHTESPLHPPFIIITGHGDKALAIDALRSGAFDFLEKPFPPSILVTAVERALVEKKSDIAFSRTIKTVTANGQLTSREIEVAILAGQGLTNEQIAQRLMVSGETIKTHLKNIFKKLAIENRMMLTQAVKAMVKD